MVRLTTKTNAWASSLLFAQSQLQPSQSRAPLQHSGGADSSVTTCSTRSPVIS